MSIRQSKIVRLAVQHRVAALPVEGSEHAVEVAIPYAAYTHAMTGATMPAGVDHERVCTVKELLAVLGY